MEAKNMEKRRTFLYGRWLHAVHFNELHIIHHESFIHQIGPVTNFSSFSACQKMWVRKENIEGTPVEPIQGQWPTFQAFLLVKKCEYARKTWEVHPWDQFWGLNIHYMIFLSTNKGQWPTFQAFLLVKKCEYKWKTWEVHP